MISRTLKQLVSLIIGFVLVVAGRGEVASVHAQAKNQSEETVNLLANFHVYGEVKRFGLGYGDLEFHFGANSPVASLGKMEFVPGGAFRGSGVFSDMNLPAGGFTVVDKTFSVPFSMVIDQPASLYMGIGENGIGGSKSSNTQIIFDFSNNATFVGSILGSTGDQGFKLVSVTMADGTSLEESKLELTFDPAKTLLTAAVSAFDTQGASLVTNKVYANNAARRAFVSLNKATASSKLMGGPDIGDVTTGALIDLDLLPEPDPYVADVGYAIVSGSGNILLTRITPPIMVDAGPDQTVDEGSQVSLHATGIDPAGEVITYAWDLDNNGTFETPGQDVTFTAVDGSASQTITVQATRGRKTATDNVVVTIDNVDPQATFVASLIGNEKSSLLLSLDSPVDPGELDRIAGFLYGFDCGDGSGYTDFSALNTATCSADFEGTRTVKAIIRDKDDGQTEYATSAYIPSISPANGEHLSTDRPKFNWEDVEGAQYYRLQVSVSSNFSNVLINITVTKSKYTVTRDLPQNKTLYWRVRAKTSTMMSPWLVKQSFVSGNPPTVPALTIPANNALVKDYSPTLNWNDSRVPAGTTIKHYEIQLDDNKEFSSPETYTTTPGDINDSDYTLLTDLASNTRFYWRVRAINEVNGVDHTSGWSSVRWFRTIILAPTGLTVVPNGLKPTFEWDAAIGPGLIKSYTIQVSTNAKFSSFVLNSTTQNAFYAMTKNLPSGKLLYWRVRVNGANGPSAWTTVEYTTP